MFLEPVEEVAVNEAATAALANPDVFREQVRKALMHVTLCWEFRHVHPSVDFCIR